MSATSGITQITCKTSGAWAAHLEPWGSENYPSGGANRSVWNSVDIRIGSGIAYVPILSNPKNHIGWPEVARTDVKKQIYNLRTLIWQVKGKITGQTLLPMPMGIEDILQPENLSPTNPKTLELKSNIEKIVIKWATQINEILNEEFTKKTGPPIPEQSELNYWSMRLNNMESLYQQLKDPRVTSMRTFLEEMESPYSEYFTNLIKHVAASLLETRDINLYLKPLEYNFRDVEACEFKDLSLKLKTLLHCACLMWANSKYYNLERMIALLQEITNLLISQTWEKWRNVTLRNIPLDKAIYYYSSQSVKHINPSTLFEADIEEIKARLLEVPPVLENYQDTFRYFKEKVENYFKGPSEPVLWTFHEKLVFDRIHKFEKRLKEVESLFDVAQDYLKLERIEMASLKARSLLNMTLDIYEEFNRAYQYFAEVPYEILSPDETQFTNDLEDFFMKVTYFYFENIEY
ncbi:dynein beta chain, ciliary-like [Augochlora pura]